MEELATLLGWLLGFLLAGLVVGLTLPIRIRMHVAVGRDELAYEAIGTWGFGLLKARISSRQQSGLWLFGFRLRETFWAKKSQQKFSLSDLKKGFGKDFRLDRIWKQQKVGLVKLRSFVAVFNLRGALHGMVGLDDPADTAILATVIQAVRNRLPRLNLAVQPIYTQECIDLRGFVGSTIWPFAVIWVLIRMFLEKQFRRLPIERLSNR